MIGVIDYEAGNITSVVNGLNTIGAKHVVSHDTAVLEACDGIILPGVGAAPGAMRSLESRGLITFITSCTKPFLGICLGMQLLYETSEEGRTACLGVLPGAVKLFDGATVKIPHMGWNEVRATGAHPGNVLMRGIGERAYFYFAHSYYAPVDAFTMGVSEDGTPFSAMMNKGNFFGVQFHPEKSGERGLMVLNNFQTICSSYPR